MSIPTVIGKKSRSLLGLSYDEYGMPYVIQINEKGERIYAFNSSFESNFHIRLSQRLLHENKLLRNPFILQLLPQFQKLPSKYKKSTDKNIEKINVKRLIIGAGTSAIASISQGSLAIGFDILGDIIYDDSPSAYVKKVELVRVLKDEIKQNSNRIINGLFIGKFDEGLLFELSNKFLLVNAEEIVISAGGRTLKPFFKNNTLPGIVSREFFLKRLKNSYKNSKVVVLGFNDLAVKTALNTQNAIILHPKGVPLLISKFYKEILNERGIETINALIEDVKRNGDKIIITTNNGDVIEAKLIVFSVAKQPRIEVTYNLGLDYIYSEEYHIYVPYTDEIGRSGNTYVTGGMRGIIDEYLSYLSGKASKGERVDEFLKLLKGDQVSTTFSFSPYYYGNGGIVCECEEVYLDDIKYAMSLINDATIEDIKRLTGLGTGECQGKACTASLGDLIKSHKLISYRSPLYPVII
ncbi:MAG: NAD(P)/FAD-dependent oxidoreductase [Sulfolobus sp.]|jgi:sarcosine oxidase subunit alpha